MEINILGISLIKSKFERSRTFEPVNDELTPNLSVEIETIKNTKRPGVDVIFSINFKVYSIKKSNYLIDYSSTHIANVQISDSSNMKDEDLHKFGSINIAAMIYPFIREDLSNRVIKSGLHSILLPPMNFVKRYEESLKKNNFKKK